MRFNSRANDVRIHALVVGHDRPGEPIAATWRKVGESAWELGLPRPGYHMVRLLVLAARARRAARRGTRAAWAGVVRGLVSSRVVDLPIALDALALARAKERIVSDQHKPP